MTTNLFILTTVSSKSQDVGSDPKYLYSLRRDDVHESLSLASSLFCLNNIVSCAGFGIASTRAS